MADAGGRLIGIFCHRDDRHDVGQAGALQRRCDRLPRELGAIPGRVEHLDGVAGGPRQPAQAAARGHAADEDAGVGGMSLHADPVPQDRAPAEGRGRVHGHDPDGLALGPEVGGLPLDAMGDEPTGNLDSQNSQIVFDILRELARDEGQTIIAVTHDDEFAAKCDRIIELEDGELVS